MQRRKIFIDAGHGGRDPGAVGNGMRESDIALEVSLNLSDILVRAGFETRLSRTTDVSPAERWQEANRWGADLLMSVHINAGGGTGVETLIPTASPKNPSRNLAECRILAEIISNTLGSAFNMRVRRANGVMLETETRHTSIGVLRNSRMLAVLPEIAFIDSPLSNPDINVLRNRRKDVAQALANAIFQFYNVNPQQETPQAPTAPAIPTTPIFPIAEENIRRMVELGVIGSPDFWHGVDNVRWLNELLERAGQRDTLHRNIDNGISDLDTALKVLEMAGVMNSPNYWREQVQSGVVRFLDSLIINIANRCLDPLHRIVWAEARGEDLRGQVLVAEVVLNRHNSSQFPNGIYNVIHQPRQFTPITNGAYDRATPLPLNRQAVNDVLSGVSHSRGALFFRTIRGAEGSWHQTALTHLFDHGAHRFFM